MVFSSVEFLFVFLPITLAGYYLIRRDLKNVFLLLMSLLFYAIGEPKFVWIMVASIVVNYLSGLLVWKAKSFGNKPLEKFGLLISIIVNLSILFYFKYYDFAVSNINGLFGTNIALKHIALPIGISFFTFQGMSYVLDVYMNKAEVQKNPLNIALYISLFPQLVAGPIVRYSDVNNQIACRKETVEDFAEGVKRFILGFGKKVIISDTLGMVADRVFDSNNYINISVLLAWLGGISYMLQIYYDFSGYSDMAIGLGKMLGFKFNENFNYPYIASSVRDFWRRWHISLSTYFRDYVYIPLGGNRKGNVYVNLSIVFLLTGIWHGASWNFIIWGVWHGIFQLIERFIYQHKKDKEKNTVLSFFGHIYILY